MALGESLAKFSLQFATALAFTPKEGPLDPTLLNNATVSLVMLGGKPLGITNHHVIDVFRAKSAEQRMTCQLGNAPIDPLARLISESSRFDLAILDLAGVEPRRIRGAHPEIPCQFHVPRSWPPDPPHVGDFITFGGFPGTKRRHLRGSHVEFGAMCSGASEVISVQTDVITSQIRLDQCVTHFDKDGRGFEGVPGLSGAPSFLPRLTTSRVEVLDFIGVVFEYHDEWDTLRLRPTSLITESGHVVT
jgi:hypothetical protein